MLGEKEKFSPPPEDEGKPDEVELTVPGDLPSLEVQQPEAVEAAPETSAESFAERLGEIQKRFHERLEKIDEWKQRFTKVAGQIGYVGIQTLRDSLAWEIRGSAGQSRAEFPSKDQLDVDGLPPEVVEAAKLYRDKVDEIYTEYNDAFNQLKHETVTTHTQELSDI